MLVIGTFGIIGCNNQSVDDDHEKVEHFIPAHWPSDLVDASDKITQRASQLIGQSTTDATTIESELRDIVGWVPEIAADTDLTEAQWDPIHQASEKLSKRLAKMPRPLDESTRSAIEEYSNLLVEAAKLLPPEIVIEEASEESQ
jgi:hypothetical protein